MHCAEHHALVVGSHDSVRGYEGIYAFPDKLEKICNLVPFQLNHFHAVLIFAFSLPKSFIRLCSTEGKYIQKNIVYEHYH